MWGITRGGIGGGTRFAGKERAKPASATTPYLPRTREICTNVCKFAGIHKYLLPHYPPVGQEGYSSDVTPFQRAGTRSCHGVIELILADAERVTQPPGALGDDVAAEGG